MKRPTRFPSLGPRLEIERSQVNRLRPLHPSSISAPAPTSQPDFHHLDEKDFEEGFGRGQEPDWPKATGPIMGDMYVWVYVEWVYMVWVLYGWVWIG